MTNSILNPIVSLDPFLYVSGKEISNDADALVNIGKMQNYLHGSLRSTFGVCANAISPEDARVVSVDHGCGAHSEATFTEPVLN